MLNNKAIRSLYIAFLVLFVAMFINVLYINITGKHLVSNANIKEYKKERDNKSEVISAKRGTIYDRNGEVIAKDTLTYTLVAYLNRDRIAFDDSGEKISAHVDNPEEYAKKLAPLLKMKEKTLLSYLNKDPKKFYQTYIGIKGKGLSLSTKEAIEKLNLRGIEFETAISRYYPNGVFASSTIGYATYDEKQRRMVGRLGVEADYEKELRGQDGQLDYETDGSGYIRRETKRKEAVNGSDVYLTLDNNIQRIVESNLEELYKTNRPSMAFAVVANAKTNEILAVSNRPTFNPNKLNIKDYNNPFVSLQFEPGSTMKTFTYAAAMDQGVYKGKAKFNSNSICIMDSGTCVQKINNYDNLSWGRITYDQGYMHSSNTGIINLFNHYFKTSDFEKYLDRFKFYQKTGIDIAGEASGSKQMDIKQEKYTTGFGQASSTTPVQIIQAYSAITNQGKMMKPYITSKIVGPDKKTTNFKPTVVGQPIKAQTAQKMLKLMSQVVENPIGTGYTYYRINDYKIAGKTGTAEYVKNGKYATCSTCYYNSFLSSAPASNPDIIVYLVTKDENGNGSVQYGARGKFIKNVTSNTLAYLNSKPDKKSKTSAKKNYVYEVESFINKSVQYAKNKLKKQNVKYVIIGNGKNIINQSPVPYTTLSNDQTIFLLTDAKSYQMINLKGYSKTDVMKLASLLNVEVKTSGTGYVTSQNIKVGKKLSDKTVIKVKLK